LAPFDFVGLDPVEATRHIIWNIAYFVPVGVLLARLHRQDWGRVLAAAVVVPAGIEFLQLFVYTRRFDTTDVVTGAAAVLAGWGLGRLVSWGRRAWAAGPGLPGGARAALLLAWLAVAVFLCWQPFNFLTDLRLVGERLANVSPLPFADYYTGTDYNAFDQFLHKMLLFIPVGVLLTPAASPGRARHAWPVLLAAAALGALLEGGQLFLPEHYASLTDILADTSGAWLGFVAASRLQLAALGNPALQRTEGA
jgi:glycopeptide antibiotics resistance protein